MNSQLNTPSIEQLLKNMHHIKQAHPSDAFRKNARIRIMNTITTPRAFKLSWYQKPRVAGYIAGSAIATFIFSAGTVFAAQSSLPNALLYPIKIASEKVALTLSPSTSLKTTVASSIISRRIDELKEAQKSGNEKAIDESITNFNNELDTLDRKKGILRTSIDQTISKHRIFL